MKILPLIASYWWSSSSAADSSAEIIGCESFIIPTVQHTIKRKTENRDPERTTNLRNQCLATALTGRPFFFLTVVASLRLSDLPLTSYDLQWSHLRRRGSGFVGSRWCWPAWESAGRTARSQCSSPPSTLLESPASPSWCCPSNQLVQRSRRGFCFS